MSRGEKYFKKIKKDYQCKHLSNPFFHKFKKKSRKHLFVYWLIFGILFFILIIWFFFISPVWQIRNIKVEGLTHTSDVNVISKVWEQANKPCYGFLKQNNIWLFDKEELEENILAAYNFSSLKIVRKPTKTLIIKISERPYAFIFQEGSQFFYASSDGFIVRDAIVAEPDKSKYFILENKNSTSLIDEKNKINILSSYLSFILELATSLSNNQELPVERYIIDQEFNTIKVDLKDGPQVYFNTKTDIKSQIERLILVKKEKIKDNFSKTSYVDLRYGDRIFIY